MDELYKGKPKEQSLQKKNFGCSVALPTQMIFLPLSIFKCLSWGTDRRWPCEGIVFTECLLKQAQKKRQGTSQGDNDPLPPHTIDDSRIK